MFTVATETIERPVPVNPALLEPADEPYAIIPLHGKYGQGLVAKVSLEDAARVRQHRWYCDPEGYVQMYESLPARKSFRVIKLHRFIFGLVHGDERLVDHKRGDRLDNRRSKIRVCTTQQNTSNKRPQKGKKFSKLKGVTFADGSWRGMIKVNDASYALGAYDTEEEAAQAYDKAARYHFGEFAFTNFPGTEAESARSIQEKRILEARLNQESNYLGVMATPPLNSGKVKWKSRITSERQKYDLGRFDTAEEAAQAYDSAALFLFGPDAETNFATTVAKDPAEIILEYRQKYQTSKYIGVRKDGAYFDARITPDGLKGKQHFLGYYRTEEEAARAFDAAARHFHGVNAKTNFGGTETLSPAEIKARRKPVPRKPDSASKYAGVSWRKKSSRWYAGLMREGKKQHLGSFKNELDAARAYDDARAAHGLPRVNFPDEARAA